MDNLLKIQNGQAIPRSSIPQVSYNLFFRALSDFVKNDGYIVQFFAYQDQNTTKLVAVVRNSELYVIGTEVGESFQSLTGAVSEKFHMFEREIAELAGEGVAAAVAIVLEFLAEQHDLGRVRLVYHHGGAGAGGIGGIAPSRRQDLSTLGLRAMLGGTTATWMTATLAGVLA